VCLCNEGYRGNGVTGCTRGECTSLVHSTCPDHRACYDSTCIDPCGPTFCGGGPCCNPTADCRAVSHLAECSCPPGTEGEPRADRGGTCRRSSRPLLVMAPCQGVHLLVEPQVGEHQAGGTRG